MNGVEEVFTSLSPIRMKNPFSTQLLDEILTKVDIVNVISEYVSLKKAGTSFKSLCPFHEEKTPSFFVNPEKQIFHCFGCGIGGNVFTFLKNIEKISFHEAVILAAKKVGIEISNTDFETSKEKEEIFQANKITAEIYNEFILSNKGRKGIEYLYERNLNENHVKKFKLGYAPNEGNFLLNKVKEKKLKLEIFNKSGLIDLANGKDFFRNRIIFPIYDLKENIVGFGARVIEENQIPKYLNTSENIAFNKSWTLYGINWAKEEIIKKGYVIVVEGYFDVLKLQINGMSNVVSPLGTAITDSHLKLLKKITNKILFLFDSDEAGIKAMKRSIENILRNGFEIKIGALPSGFDPDKFVEEYGIESLKNFISQSQDFLHFNINIGKQIYDLNSPKEKSLLTKEIIYLISQIPDEIEKNEYIKQLSKEMDIEENILKKYMEEIEKTENPIPLEEKQEPKKLGKEWAENLLIEILYSDKNYWDRVFQWKGYLTERIEKIINVAEKLKEKNIEIKPSVLIGNIEEEDIANWLSNIGIKKGKEWEEEKKEKIFQDCIKKLNKISLQEKMVQIKKQLKEKEKSGISYDEELKELQKLLISIKKG